MTIAIEDMRTRHTLDELQRMTNPWPMRESHAADCKYVADHLCRYADPRPPSNYTRKFECILEDGLHTHAVAWEVVRRAMIAEHKGHRRLPTGLRGFFRIPETSDLWPDSWPHSFLGPRDR